MKKTLFKKSMAWLLALMMVITFMPAMAFAEAGAPPANDKSVSPNGDGTFTIELSVTGDADPVEEEAGGVNVVIVYDISQSMTSNAGTSRNSRADQAEDVVHDFLANLATYQNSAQDNIRVSLVNFAVTGNQIQGWTTNVTGLANRFDDGGTDGNTNFTYNGYGTNWESALQRAQTLVNGVNNPNPTFVVMITDGAPTASGNGNDAIAPTGATIQQLRQRYNPATDEASAIATAVESTGGTFYGIYAYGTEADLFDDLMYYSENGQHRGGSINNVVAATQEAPNYFNAGETAQLQAAIDEIFDKVVQAMGISSVSISDGTTNEVTVGSDVAELLEIDENSYRYWLSIPVVNNSFTRIDREGNTVEYTVTNNGDGTSTVTWGSTSVIVQGTVSGGQLKYEWTEANELYNYNPPEAKLEDSAVNWDLNSVGTLLDGVTYSVTFKCYPSQTTLDIVADIMNDPYVDEQNQGAWGKLPAEIRQYIDETGKLTTNTEAVLTYSDTRLDEPGPKTERIENDDPVESDAVEQVAITKDWKNLLESEWEKPDDVKIEVMRGDEIAYELTLNDDNDWSSKVFISIGIMGEDNKPLEGSEGHDFSFVEPEGLGYHWEIDAPVMHPMMIGGELAMLIKVDAKHPLPDDYEGEVYTINDAKYYVDEAATAIKATNERRSSLQLTKVVDGDDAPEDAIFPFTVNIVNSKAPATPPSEEDDPGHDSDYWVWISVRDKDGGRITEGVEGAISAGGGWWYAPSGTNVTIPVKAGYSIRFNNLPTGSTYTLTEGTPPTGFVFDEAKIEVAEGVGTTSTFMPGQKSTGTIETTNALYQVTYTNTYELVDINVNKVWDDNSDQDGIRPDTLALTLNGAPSGVTVPTPTVTESQDGNTWTYTWKAVPRYDGDGEEIEYTVTEEENAVPAGYSVKGSPAKDGGTITNTHATEKTSVKVTKEWNDANNQDGKRPASVSVQLKANGEALGDPVTLDANNWSHTWTNLDKKANGAPIVYSVEEKTSVAGYEAPVYGGDAENGFTITNKHTPETTSITVNKVWADRNDRDGIRPNSVTVRLSNGQTAELNSANNWTATFNNLPVYSNGNRITYTVDEPNVPQGYQKSVSGFTITNTHSSSGYIPDEPVPLDLNGEDHFAYIEGYPDGTVQPEGNITRAEVATMIYRLLTFDRRDEIFTSESNYSDVDLQNWFNKAVASMTVGEYVEGYPDGTFKPNQKITRAEFVTIVVRFLEGERDAENPFTDIDSHWAKKYILSAVDAGWIDGYPDGTFRPQEPIKRDEAMKIMNTILHRGINEESELGEPVMFPDNADPSAWYYYEVIEATNNHDTEGERPDEDWLSNECEYAYDIQKYERPDGAAPAPQDDPATPDDQDEPAVTDNSIVGQWAYTEEGVDGAFVYTFNEDGTGNYDMAGTVKAFTYTIEGNTLSILYEGDTEPFELPFVVTDTTLTVKDSNDEDVVYNKK